MAGETEDEIPESGAVFTFGKSKFADNAPSKFWLKNDVPLRISCGDEHTALVTENGKLFMFGSNNWGQLGLGTKTTVNKPTCVKALKSESVKLAACGRTHSLVYTSRGNLYASGGNNEGQLGLGDCDDRTSFHLVDFFSKHGPIKMLAAGSNTSAVLTQDGRLYMWGDNSEGQIGLGKESNALTPHEVSVGKRVSWVSCGYYHSAFVTVDGALFTFGEKDSGKLGLSTEKLANHKVPQQVTGISDKVVKVSCGGGHTVALTEHKVYSFGLGQFGQLGHGTFIFESRLPRVVEHFRRGRVKHVDCGENHTALITDSGLLYTFGDGRHGKLGLGEENFTNQFRPTLCTRFLNCHVHSVTCGGCHMLVLAKPRAERSEDLILEEDDITEDYFDKSCTELLGDTLNRSLSARVRRRERERSPDQFGQMFRTLPALGGHHLSASLSVPSQIRHSQSNQPGKIPHNSLKIPGKREKSLDDRSSVEDSESVKDLGETTDLLNLTHIIKLDPSDKTLTLSPMEKKKVKVVHGKEKGKHSDGHAPYSKRVELSARKALPTELLRSSSGSSVVEDSLGSGTPQKCPKRHGHDKENVLIALENRKPAYHQAGGSKTRLGSDISRTGSKSYLPKHTELMKSMEKVTKDSTGKAKPNQEAESEKVAQKSKGSTKPNQEGIGKAKPKDRPLEVRSQPQTFVGKEKEVKMKPIIVVEHHLEQTTHKDQDPTGKKISKDDLPKAQRVKGETNAAKTENKTFVPQSKKSDSKKDSKSNKTIQEISTTSQQSSCQEDVSTKKTKKSRAEQSQLLVEDKLKNTKKGPTIVSEAASKSESASEAEQIKENPLIKVTSFLQDVGMGSPACLLGASAVSQFLSQSTPQNMPKPPSKQRTLSDVSSLSESEEVSRQEETREAKRTAVTINMRTESGTSDGDLERSSIESKTEAHSEVGTYKRSEEESDEEEEEESKALVNRRDESEEVDDSEEESEGKTLDKVADDDDFEVDGDTTTKGSSEDEESEEEEDKSKSEATEDVESEAEEGESDRIEDKEEETSEISKKSEEESRDEQDESKTSKEEETESKNESSKEESDEENEESEVKDSEDEEENDVESDSAEEDSAEEDEDSEKTSEEKEDSEKLESESEDEGDDDGEKTSEEEEDDSEKQESETEGESESEAEEESEKVKVDEEEGESNEEEAMSQNDEEEEEEESENEEEEEQESNDEGEEEQESEEEEEQESKDEEEEEQESEEEEEQESTDEEEEEQESKEEEEQESKDEEEEEQESKDEEEEEESNEEDDDDEEDHPEEKEGEKCEEKEDVLDEKRKETEEQEQSTPEPDIQKKQIIKEASVPDGLIKDSDPATLIKEETQSERNGVSEDKPKTRFGSRNRLSLFKRSPTKGNRAESSASGKPAADGPPQISETRGPESSSSQTQIGGTTTASSRSRSATCNLL
ncbi:retinitis pigmentosa GTPase regulator b isoform X2 [Rhinichthys klamathensis goyatoka]|uniref:retinitis pigmentosa GTPase regulator b isoform X2 n=1 Tax=Rhinichthys klamathensis goyatoka TaxID=3034132 RepID=UPI0024B4C868|nr:retinitis pigmentosa GTPase regulator b isoform X2 [Rhinichthys klamathensis goyatoka]